MSVSIALQAAILILLQSSPGQSAADKLKVGLAETDILMNQRFDCLDTATKTEMKAHIFDSTPESVTDAAIVACSSITDRLRAATAKTLASNVSYSEALQQATQIEKEGTETLRAAYVKQINTMYSEPGFAKGRLRLAVGDWSACVKDKAISWSKLKDEAKTVAEAAVTSCSDKRKRLKPILRYVAISDKIPPASLDVVETKVAATMGENAVKWVIEERAKHLPK